ncbi:CCR4-NOT transcription complex subunit 10-B-like [Centruroides sculpturatus]|uniref:CCR4-NOT transcription complex subunit 10-B-like n=1 Tax=Centruroides sculpturatus TaxID=218467 RepID=UPI000C6EE475|nr:CCR4-NOT transcription complex subunit 10-B-like [Centruroides sculpturatus]
MSEAVKDGETEKTSNVTTDQVPLIPTISDQEKELASLSYQAFEKGKYEDCLLSLSQLIATRSNDLKVYHNKAVAEYYSSDFINTNDFQKILVDICNQARINIDNVETLEDVDHCILFFNQAIILFHLHQYHATITILDKLFQFIEPLAVKDGETEKTSNVTTDQVPLIPTISDQEKELASLSYQAFEKGKYEDCLLSLSQLIATRSNDLKVYHNKAVAEYYSSDFINTNDFQKILVDICNQPEKALSLISYIETMLFGNNKINESKTQASEKDKEQEKDKEKENNKESETKEKDTVEINQNEIYRPKLQHYKARCYIMLKSAKFCKREIKSLMNSGVNIPAIYLRSQLEYLRGSYRKSLKVLNTATSSGTVRPVKETGDNLTVMYYNNIGCIHFYMGKPHLASFYFNKALKEHDNAIAELTEEEEREKLSVRPLPTMNLMTRYHLLYNLGIQYLHIGCPDKAFDCLIEVVRIYHVNPRLWLRLAECCIQFTKPESSLDFHLNERKKDMVQKVVGGGIHRKIILSPYLSNNYKISDLDQTSAMPTPTLEFAAFCLRNALMLLPEEQSSGMSSQGSVGDESEAFHPLDNNTSIIALPSNPIQGNEIASLRNSILIASSYVALCLGDVVVALKHAETLLLQPRISGAHRLLAHLYAAEALILMDHIAEAIQHLNPDQIKDVSFTLPFSSEGDSKPNDKPEENNKIYGNSQNWLPNTVNSARMIMIYNMAVAYTLRGELEKAGENLRLVGVSRSSGTDIPVQALMLAMYIQLQQGHADLARSIIKQHLPQYR